MKGGSNVVIEQHRHEGVFIARGKEDALVTKNLVPGVRLGTSCGLKQPRPAYTWKKTANLACMASHDITVSSLKSVLYSSHDSFHETICQQRLSLTAGGSSQRALSLPVARYLLSQRQEVYAKAV